MSLLHSVRARLTVWWAGAFAVMLAAFALLALAFLARTSAVQTDEVLAATLTAVAGAIDAERAEGVPDVDAASEVARELRFRDHPILILDRPSEPGPAEAPRTHGSGAAPRALDALLREVDATTRTAPRPRAPAPVFRTVGSGAHAVRLGALPHHVGRRTLVVGVATPLTARHQLLRRAALALLLGVPAMVLVASAGGWWLARRSLAPVVAMSEEARRMGASTLHGRLPVGNPNDELGRLATTFNDLLARLEAAFEQQRRFVADASHELRTPVAVVHGEASLALARPDRTPDELRDALGIVRGEAARLRAIVDDLFLLARADARDRELALEELYLEDVVADALRGVRSLAAAKGVALEETPAGDGESLPFRGDPVLLARLLRNLLDNAVKHTPPRGAVRVTATRAGSVYRVAVHDTGGGIPEEARELVFERFYRLGRDTTATTRGDSRRPGLGDAASAGLGLPIARWIAEAHGGRLVLDETGPGGTTFLLELPVPPRTPPIRATPTAAFSAASSR